MDEIDPYITSEYKLNYTPSEQQSVNATLNDIRDTMIKKTVSTPNTIIIQNNQKQPSPTIEPYFARFSDQTIIDKICNEVFVLKSLGVLLNLQLTQLQDSIQTFTDTLVLYGWMEFFDSTNSQNTNTLGKIYKHYKFNDHEHYTDLLPTFSKSKTQFVVIETSDLHQYFEDNLLINVVYYPSTNGEYFISHFDFYLNLT